MDLASHYNALYNESIVKIASGNCQTDHLIDSSSDKRLGLTLIMRPNAFIKNKIQGFLQELRAVDSNQYYYPDTDIHITVMSIISCYDGFRPESISIPDYISVIEKSLEGISNPDILFRGITASPSAIMIQGFMPDDSLNEFRNNLRNNFRNSGLDQTIDQRYVIAAAHATVARFRKPIENTGQFVAILEKYRDFDFGEFSVNHYDLVCNDWYLRQQNTLLLRQF